MPAAASRHPHDLLHKCLSVQQLNQLHAHLLVHGASMVPSIACSSSPPITRSHPGRGMASCAMPATCSMKFPIQTESCARSALHHHGMLRRGMLPNEFTLSFVLKACTRVQAWATRRWSMPWSWNWASCSKCLWVTRLCIPMRWLVPLEILVWPF
jgi:hypothetical protein